MALIRATFGVDPVKLSESEFVKLATEAMFIKDFDRRQFKTAIEETLIALMPKK